MRRVKEAFPFEYVVSLLLFVLSRLRVVFQVRFCVALCVGHARKEPRMRIKLKASLLLLPALLGALGVFAASDIAAEVKYFYAKDGTIIGRAVNGVRSNFEYDAKGQLLAVRDAKTGELRKKYTYDSAGNILSKTVYGKTTTYTYDGANQLINANTHDTKTSYAYDAAGRLIRAGSKSYRYGFKDKVLEVRDGLY